MGTSTERPIQVGWGNRNSWRERNRTSWHWGHAKDYFLRPSTPVYDDHDIVVLSDEIVSVFGPVDQGRYITALATERGPNVAASMIDYFTARRRGLRLR